ncbi:unnamed protein product [Pleuronectes platessa]|uniref:Uncharacterized protein n=1 Tax=Pleuronectes platessa TaxID=8262 RepID=A0A9N7UFV3_PLEPL|nr:unnamed protein product [Pleuronectes platessa]
MLLCILSLDTNRHQAPILSHITNCFLSSLRMYEQLLALALVSSCLCSVGSVHQQSSHSWMEDPNFSLAAQRAPTLRQSPRVLTWSALLTGPAPCQSNLCMGGEGAQQLESYCQPSANERQGSGGILQNRRVIGPELYYWEFEEGGGSCHMVQCDSNRGGYIQGPQEAPQGPARELYDISTFADDS